MLFRSVAEHRLQRRAGSVVVAHGLSCSAACGIFPDQGSNPCPLHWQADSQPLRHQGSPVCKFKNNLNIFFFIGSGTLDSISISSCIRRNNVHPILCISSFPTHHHSAVPLFYSEFIAHTIFLYLKIFSCFVYSSVSKFRSNFATLSEGTFSVTGDM